MRVIHMHVAHVEKARTVSTFMALDPFHLAATRVEGSRRLIARLLSSRGNRTCSHSERPVGGEHGQSPSESSTLVPGQMQRGNRHP